MNIDGYATSQANKNVDPFNICFGQASPKSKERRWGGLCVKPNTKSESKDAEKETAGCMY